MIRALYPGSFDPVTRGHLDIIERGARLFDEIIASVVANPAKQTMFTMEERAEMLEDACNGIPNVRVEVFSGLLVEHAKAMGANVIVKGLRAISDFEYEIMQAHMNRFLHAGIETLFIPTDAAFSFLSSSIVRELARLGAPIEGLVPAGVEGRVRARLAGS